ncbi:MAG: hypothetical protein RL069_1913, partial [Planctomycetota bacterium]
MLVRFRRPNGTLGWGFRSEQGIVDVSLATPTLPTSTRTLIEQWDTLEQDVLRLAQTTPPSSEPLEILCPLDVPGKILCIGLNYRDHAIETNAPIPDEPIVFFKSSNTMIGPTDPIVVPPISSEVDFEAEL